MTLSDEERRRIEEEESFRAEVRARAEAKAREDSGRGSSLAAPGANLASHGPMTMGLLGSAIMGLGVFLPFVSAPVYGTMNYFANARGDGTIILACAGLSILPFIGRTFYSVAVLCSLAAGGVLGYDVCHIVSGLQEEKAGIARDLAGNPFAGLAELMIENVRIELGTYVIGMGAILIFAAALWGNSVVTRARKQGKVVGQLQK